MSASSSITALNRSTSPKVRMPSSSAPALPTLVAVSMTLTPWPRASSTVLSVDASDTTCTFRAGTSAVMAARESSMTTSSLWAAMSTATSAMVRILPPPEARVEPGQAAVGGRLDEPVSAERPVRGRARVPRHAPESVQRVVHDTEEADRSPDGEVDAEHEREHQPGRNHEHSPRGPCSRPVPGESTSFGCRSRFTQPHPSMADTRGLAASCCAATSWMMSASYRLGRNPISCRARVQSGTRRCMSSNPAP